MITITVAITLELSHCCCHPKPLPATAASAAHAAYCCHCCIMLPLLHTTAATTPALLLLLVCADVPCRVLLLLPHSAAAYCCGVLLPLHLTAGAAAAYCWCHCRVLLPPPLTCSRRCRVLLSLITRSC